MSLLFSVVFIVISIFSKKKKKKFNRFGKTEKQTKHNKTNSKKKLKAKQFTALKNPFSGTLNRRLLSCNSSSESSKNWLSADTLRDAVESPLLLWPSRYLLLTFNTSSVFDAIKIKKISSSFFHFFFQYSTSIWLGKLEEATITTIKMKAKRENDDDGDGVKAEQPSEPSLLIC